MINAEPLRKNGSFVSKRNKAHANLQRLFRTPLEIIDAPTLLYTDLILVVSIRTSQVDKMSPAIR